jgi:hypothetical protein
MAVDLRVPATVTRLRAESFDRIFCHLCLQDLVRCNAWLPSGTQCSWCAVPSGSASTWIRSLACWTSLVSSDNDSKDVKRPFAEEAKASRQVEMRRPCRTQSELSMERAIGDGFASSVRLRLAIRTTMSTTQGFSPVLKQCRMTGSRLTASSCAARRAYADRPCATPHWSRGYL